MNTARLVNSGKHSEALDNGSIWLMVESILVFSVSLKRLSSTAACSACIDFSKRFAKCPWLVFKAWQTELSSSSGKLKKGQI